MVYWIRSSFVLLRVKLNKSLRSKESMLNATATPKMKQLNLTKMAVSNSSTLTVRHLMWGDHQCLFFLQVQFLSLPTDLSPPSTNHKKAVSCLWPVRFVSSLTSSSSKTITKRFRKLSSNGSSIRIRMLSLSDTLKKIWKLVSTTTYLILLHSLIVSAPASKNRMRCQKTSLLFSATIFTSSIPI